MLCCDVQRGPRNREVFAVPRTPKTVEGHLPTLSGTEPRTRKAPRRGTGVGWARLPRLFLANYLCRLSSPYGTSTLAIDYAGVEEAARLLDDAECHSYKTSL
jgi:hypothetical protein